MPRQTPDFSLKGSNLRKPLVILVAEAKLPLVLTGPLLLNGDPSIREDFFDVETVGWRKAGVLNYQHCAGEPYGRWI
jgi:hypothetical protein